MLEPKSAVCCGKPNLLNTTRDISRTNTEMGESRCHKTDVNGSAVSFFTKRLSPVVDDSIDLSPFQLRNQTPSPVVQITTLSTDLECCSTPDTYPVPQDSSSSHPASRPMTPAVIHNTSSPNVPAASDTSLVNANHVTPRRPRHKPGERRELLTRAVEDVLNLKISMRRAAQKYNLAKSSLCDFVRKNKICLPNLRYKSCPTVTNLVTTPSTRISTCGAKRTASDADDASFSNSTPAKLSDSDHKSNIPPRDTTCSFPSTDRVESTFDRFQPCISTGNSSGDPWHTPDVKSNLLDFVSVSALTATHPESGQLSYRFPSNLGFSKPNRIESPWHNSAGLPTQVPMRSWSTHGTQAATSSPSGGSQTFGRKIPFNSLNQLRQAMESTRAHHSEAVDLSDINSTALHVSSSFEDGNFSRSSDSFDEGVLNTTDVLSPAADLRCPPIGTPTESAETLNNAGSNLDSLAAYNGSIGLTRTETLGRPCVTPTKNDTNPILNANDSPIRVSSAYPGTSIVPGNSCSSAGVPLNFAPSFCHGEPNAFVRSRDSRCASESFELSSSMSTQSTQPPATQWSVSQQGIIGAIPSVLTTAPCSSLASILSTDFSSLNQNAVAAALLLQHSRTFAAAPSGIGAVPGLVGYPSSQSISNSSSSLFPADLTIPAVPTCASPAPSASTRQNTTRLSCGPASTLNNIAAHFWNADVSQHPSTLADLQQLFGGQVQSRFQNDVGSFPPSFMPPLVAHLIPQLYASCPNSSLRNFFISLLNSVNSQNHINSAHCPSSSEASVPSEDHPDQTAAVAGAQSTPIPFSLNDIPSPISSAKMNKVCPHARGLVDFINSSPSPFHTVQSACDLLTASGFREIKEHESWNLKPKDCVFLKKNGSTLFAAAVGGRFKPGNGFYLFGAHTDSPSLRVKPVSDRVKEGYVQLGVEAYGGGLWYTWFDRELKVAGRVVTANTSGRLEERLVHLNRPIACVPSLAIHLNQDVRSHGFNPNFEQHVVPILCTSVMEQVNKTDQDTSMNLETSSNQPADESGALHMGHSAVKRKHPTSLLRSLMHELGLPDSQDPLEVELYLSDYQPARVGGLHNEFIHAPRLDNLFNSYAGLHGLLESMDSLPEENCLRIVCLYDHEEVGSTSTQGANSSHTMNILRRMANAVILDKHAYVAGADDPMPSVSHFEESLSKSFLLSADQAHAIHPSYSDKHETNHKPQLHGGLVLKCNVNQRYATNALTAAAVRQLARLAEIPIQEFVVRQDMHCGSTIGPLLSSQLGVPTADVGFPQLAMHSCRELCCTTSVVQAVRFYSTYFEHMSKVWPPTNH